MMEISQKRNIKNRVINTFTEACTLVQGKQGPIILAFKEMLTDTHFARNQ